MPEKKYRYGKRYQPAKTARGKCRMTDTRENHDLVWDLRDAATSLIRTIERTESANALRRRRIDIPAKVNALFEFYEVPFRLLATKEPEQQGKESGVCGKCGEPTMTVQHCPGAGIVSAEEWAKRADSPPLAKKSKSEDD